MIDREVQRRVNLKWHSNGTVSYQRKKFWYYERDLSVGPLTDIVTTINLPVVSSAEFARGNYFMEWGVSKMLATIEAQILVKRSVGELLFEGYEDSVMRIGSAFGHVEGPVFLDKFGWFYEASYRLQRSSLIVSIAEEWNLLVRRRH